MQDFIKPDESLHFMVQMARERLIDLLYLAATRARFSTPEESMAHIAAAHDAAEEVRRLQNQLT